jgi:uncharacterized iron-regulated protein
VRPRARIVGAASVLLAIAGCGHRLASVAGPAPSACVPAGRWIEPAGGGSPSHADVLERASRAAIVLLGERHDVPEDHRWQLDVLAGLAARRTTLIVGFEALPRSARAPLDEWSRGQLSVDELLARLRWRETWGLDPELYLPLFHFTRRHRFRTIGLNVDRGLARQVGQRGWRAIPLAERHGIGDPIPATPAYADRLAVAYAQHRCVPPERVRDTDGLARFVDAQLLWDRAMAEALRAAASPDALVVGILGTGHLEFGDGVPRQLSALGVDDVMVLLPWQVTSGCSPVPPAVADAVFGVVPLAAEMPPPPRHPCENAPAQPPPR